MFERERMSEKQGAEAETEVDTARRGGGGVDRRVNYSYSPSEFALNVHDINEAGKTLPHTAAFKTIPPRNCVKLKIPFEIASH